MASVTKMGTCANCGEQTDLTQILCMNCGRNPRKAKPSVVEVDAPTIATTLVLELPGWVDFPLPEAGDVLLGRDDTVAQPIRSALQPYVDVSRWHATITVSSEGLSIQDLGSTFGTWVDGVSIEPNTPTPLKPLQPIVLSTTCHLRVRVANG